MSLSAISCAVTNDLLRHMGAEDSASRHASAIETQADLMLDDESCGCDLAERLMEAIYEPGTPAQVLDEFHAFLRKHLLRAAFDFQMMPDALYPDLARWVRGGIYEAAQERLKELEDEARAEALRDREAA
ncbi:hypothetical protein [Chromobacterium violaceum]|uniref:Uncharacterized protein n=1 Tax=Chromobacterium violaceum TaxID=536 RepID=A0A202B568_CHRVL|nr:hypothetical protein [Chromobacterium violaceum]OVE46713.1 hypothetical protein CBW21_17615 [Chromobacterium violaceum]